MNKQIGDMTNDELMDFIIELQEENSRYERKLDQLTNNWNELEEWINRNCFYDNDTLTYEELINKMEEIKNTNN